ncbi:hypothetical protein, partial [uncultured Acinetobacter sp.]|uniref:hypothetical protein n=1 Tax=uncultured Acinetobacter sp. TaxID=165433 RepID=UPI0025D4CB49
MKNYYEEKFDLLFTEFGSKIALEKIVEDLLFKSSQPKINNFKNKFDMFWQSKFICLIDGDELKQENYILALSQWIRYSVTDHELCKQLIEIDIESFILAMRYSGIILNVEHDSWKILEDLNLEIKSKKLKDFL